MKPSARTATLKHATDAVTKRHAHYGAPGDNFDAIARRWRAHLVNRFGAEIAIDASDVAVMMADVKLARLEHDPKHADSWIDLAGYAACGAEIAEGAR